MIFVRVYSQICKPGAGARQDSFKSLIYETKGNSQIFGQVRVKTKDYPNYVQCTNPKSKTKKRIISTKTVAAAHN